MRTVSIMALPIHRVYSFVVATLISAHAMAAPGDLDVSFNATGIVTTSLVSTRAEAHAAALQPNGKILMAGQACGVSSPSCDVLVERLNGDGSLDTTFNTTGVVTTDYNAYNDFAYAVALTTSGQPIVAGYSCSVTQCYFLLIRYLSNGNFDTTFAGSGIVAAGFASGDSRAYALALQPDGKVIAGGYSYNGSNDDFELIRYNTDGSLDSGFGLGGAVSTGFNANDDQINAIALQPDGKIVVAGQSCGVYNNCSFALARYYSNGIPDATLNGTGKLTTSIGPNYDKANGLALQPDGKIVLAGQSCTQIDASCVYALVRYNTDGSLDATFNPSGATPGILTTAIGATNDIATSVAIQPDGKIISGGFSYTTSNNVYVLVRYSADGGLDPSFGSSGIVTTDIGPSGNQAYAVALQPDSKIVMAGGSSSTTGSFLSVARYIAESSPWDLTPDAFSFADADNAALGSVQTSNTITISGLGNGIEVPVTVLSGEYAKIGSGVYTAGVGWAKNGDEFNVRHTASTTPGTSTTSALIVGGIVATNNATVTLGTTASATFTSNTTPGSTLSGGGLLGPLSFIALAALLLLSRVRVRLF